MFILKLILLKLMVKMAVIQSQTQTKEISLVKYASCSNYEYSLANTLTLGINNNTIFQYTIDHQLIAYQFDFNINSLNLKDGAGGHVTELFTRLSDKKREIFLEAINDYDPENNLQVVLNYVQEYQENFFLFHLVKRVERKVVMIGRSIWTDSFLTKESKYIELGRMIAIWSYLTKNYFYVAINYDNSYFLTKYDMAETEYKIICFINDLTGLKIQIKPVKSDGICLSSTKLFLTIQFAFSYKNNIYLVSTLSGLVYTFVYRDDEYLEAPVTTIALYTMFPNCNTSLFSQLMSYGVYIAAITILTVLVIYLLIYIKRNMCSKTNTQDSIIKSKNKSQIVSRISSYFYIPLFNK